MASTLEPNGKTLAGAYEVAKPLVNIVVYTFFESCAGRVDPA